MAINPRTFDITDDMTGAFIPYPGYGGDIALNPIPEIGLSVDAYRSKHGMPPLSSLQIAQPVTPQAPARHPAYVGPDAAAAMLADGAFQMESPVWGGDVDLGDGTMGTSAAQQAVDTRARGDINARHQRAIADIDRSARQPMEKATAAAKQTSAYEDLQQGARPLVDTMGENGQMVHGAFEQAPDGTYVNRAPAMRLGDERAARQKLLPTLQREQQTAQVLGAFQDAQARIQADMQKWHTSQGKDGIAPTEGKAALDRAERLMAMMLQNAGGGKDFSGFFRQGQQDPLAALAALSGAPRSDEQP